ncbi:MAG TPA: hypothetical protein VJ183_03365 [Chloroflexia bacterium]|nr:hypothetical protein [Chloroflexia bacterium]
MTATGEIRPELAKRGLRWDSWQLWLLIPALAVVAYAPVLSMWFVADDFDFLGSQEGLTLTGSFLDFWDGQLFYRPLSTIITWGLGYNLFGTNALPYHAVSLALHALVAWMLGRTVATISGEAGVGWLAGALFAVYPLSTEPVAWLSSQWDLWAAVCTLGAIWGFALAWKTHDWRPYAAGLAATCVGVLMKESALTLPVILPFVVLAITPMTDDGRRTTDDRRRSTVRVIVRAIVWSLPFAIPALLFVGLRVAGGGIIGYPGRPTDFQHFYWDKLVTAGTQLIMPLNRSVFHGLVVQAVGAGMTLFLLVGLVLWGRKHWPLLVLALAWLSIFLAPALNLIDAQPENFNNRLLYFSLMGFCIGLAVLLSSLLSEPVVRRFRWPLLAAILLFALPFCWLQLQPWVATSRQTQHIVREIGELIVPIPGQKVVFNTTDLPKSHNGSVVFWNGFERAMETFNKQPAKLRQVPHLDEEQLAQPLTAAAGIYNLDFSFNPQDELYYVGRLAGVTLPGQPPTGKQTWNYMNCTDLMLLLWRPAGATFRCAPTPESPPPGGSSYAVYEPAPGNDAHIVPPELRLDLSGARWLRLAVCIRLPTGEQGQAGRWRWRADNEQEEWKGESKYTFSLLPSEEWAIYWTYVPVGEVGKELHSLRLDTIEEPVRLDIAWISVDVIPAP